MPHLLCLNLRSAWVRNLETVKNSLCGKNFFKLFYQKIVKKITYIALSFKLGRIYGA